MRASSIFKIFWYSQISQVLADLRGAVESKLQDITDKWLQEDVDPSSLKFIILNFMTLVEKLKAQGKLPVLVFRLATFCFITTKVRTYYVLY